MQFKSILILSALQAALSTATVNGKKVNKPVEGWAKWESKGNLTGVGMGSYGEAVLENRCSYDIWAWSVDSVTGSTEAIQIPKRTTYREPVRKITLPDGNSAGVSVKISNTEMLQAKHHTQFEYTIKNDRLWYDLSFVDCALDKSSANCPGAEKGLKMDFSEKKCKIPYCPPGQYCPTQSYFVDTPVQKLGIPEPTFNCDDAGTSMNIYMHVCADEKPIKRSIAGRITMDEEQK
ncbi:unnamed protein product [Periconia digitata]|uniref:Uncharacterized protein n=1 Tax=Periconia digitata TaxID=1303443 RepID=A0A9W4U9K0_9PLEO|nr:unnamed protein product [Periconia digitata]